MSLNGKVAIVTGAIRGIGRGTAEDLMDEGANVLACYSETPEEAAENIAEMTEYAKEKGVKFVTYHMDQRNYDEVVASWDYAVKELGDVDILVCNAGINIKRMAIWEYEQKDYDLCFDVNVKGTWYWVKQAGTRLNDNGRIVLVSSSSVEYPITGHGIYSPSKAAVEMMAIDASLEFGERGITVNSVSPGLTPNTGLGKLKIVPDAMLQNFAKEAPMKRLGEPEDVGRAIVCLCQDKAYWISGQCIVASGGARA